MIPELMNRFGQTAKRLHAVLQADLICFRLEAARRQQRQHLHFSIQRMQVRAVRSICDRAKQSSR
jgi:hypothetical protein